MNLILYFSLSLLYILIATGPVSSLTGIQFGDNAGQKFVTEKNGVALATTQVDQIFEIIVLKNPSFRFPINYQSVLGFIHSGADGIPGWEYLK